VYVLGTFFRPAQHHHAPRTRITLMVNATLWVYWRLSRIFGGTRIEPPQVFKDGYGTKSTFVVGVIHGLGAETPTQLLLFLLAANLGGTWVGLLGLLVFIVGLLVMNTLMCGLAAGLFSLDHLRNWIALAGPPQNLFSRALNRVLTWVSEHALRGLTLLTSAYSIVVGTIFLLGAADKLPSLTG
jgi:hypothetical protein